MADAKGYYSTQGILANSHTLSFSETNAKQPSKKALKKQAKEEEKAKRKAETAARIVSKRRENGIKLENLTLGGRERIEKRRGKNAGSPLGRFTWSSIQDHAKDRYGVLPIIQSSAKSDRTWTKISELTLATSENRALVRARVHTTRGTGRQCFIALRQQQHSVQGLLFVNETISKQMVKFAAR